MKNLMPIYFVFVLLCLLLPFVFGFNNYVIYLYIFNATVLILSFVFYRFSSRVFTILIVNIFLLLLGQADKFILSDSISKDRVNLVSNANLQSYAKDIKLLIKNSSTSGDLDLATRDILKKAKSLVLASDAKSNLEIARIYEMLAIAGLNDYKDEAKNAYTKYCQLAPNNAECYASLARVIILDTKLKSEALPYAMKALELAQDDEALRVYNELVNYIEKL
jgi:hypothetical protein